MKSKNQNVDINCKKCEYLSDDKNGSFDILVPVEDSETGLTGSAKLHCSVSDRQHRVNLEQWLDDDAQPIEASSDLTQRLTATLETIEQQKICGNCNICPSEVVQIVDQTKR